MRYVAVGDSFTEGVGDEPSGPDTPRGWADLVAAGLAAANGGIDYANLAVRGRLLAPIATEQIDAALALDPLPTVMTFNGGGNDALRPGIDPAHLLDLIRTAVRRARDAGIDVVVLAGADPSDGLPFGSTIRRRCAHLTDETGVIAAQEGATFVDVFHDEEIRGPGYWSDDRLHLNPTGHRRVAALVLQAMGVDDAVLPDPPAPHPGYGLTDDLRFYRGHLAPWVMRRLRRQSSGDLRAAKYSTWTAVAPNAADRL
ncbi:SGNH/GDSL hydrolase family protein [Gordonia sp. CPCC 206044]|uniref:SGNH/GDSL hydrolase family protein n=1 Tax=Gordonia sp. CPCC 206044 TaxID=3140793 RepID=UPI003AF39E38